MKRNLILLQVVAIALLIWALVLGFSVLQGKAAPSTHMNVAVVAAVVSIATHAFALVSSPRRSPLECWPWNGQRHVGLAGCAKQPISPGLGHFV